MTGPFEPPGGQEPDQPHPTLVVLVAIRLLRDVRDHLDGSAPRDVPDLLLRIGAVLAVLKRYRERLTEAESDGGQ